MDDLRREFEAYRRETALVVPEQAWARPTTWELPARAVELSGPALGISDGEGDGQEDVGPTDHALPGADREVVFRPGMTMDDMEREAIRAALEAVDGNRRKAAEMLDIGERTLYRKISKYGLDG